MITIAEMEEQAHSYLSASRILSQAAHAKYDAAAYLCGYAVEIALKVRICRTLGWPEFPTTRGDFQNYASFKVHNLETLLHLSGRELQLKADAALLTDWSVVRDWNPEQRYAPLGTKTAGHAEAMTSAAEKVLLFLL